LAPGLTAKAAPVRRIGAVFVCGLGAAAAALATPEGADWNIAATPEGCASCHLGATPVPDGAVLRIEGLPDAPTAGMTYELTVVLEDPDLVNAGFLLTLEAGDAATGPLTAVGEATGTLAAVGDAAGELAAVDERVEVDASGTRARSTWAGSFQAAPGEGRWQLNWTAPANPAGGIRLDLWANAGNDDLSPLGDRPWHRRWQLR
jgi:hypothetical protein